MSQDYKNFFKKAKENKQGASVTKNSFKINKKGSASGDKKSSPKYKQFTTDNDEQTAEEYLRHALNVKKNTKPRKKRSGITLPTVLILAGLSCATAGFFHPEYFEKVLSRIEVSVLTGANAAEEVKPAETAGDNSANNAASTKVQGASECTEKKGFTEEELSHFNKLNDRKNELDRREAELNLLEEELHKQKSEIEERISKLEQIRNDVAGVLKERVEVDQQRVNTLVDFYSNMKPKQAAEIFGKLNEDLAVEVLGKMKKKNAADIMNLLDTTKARALSEKFAGYKRR